MTSLRQTFAHLCGTTVARVEPVEIPPSTSKRLAGHIAAGFRGEKNDGAIQIVRLARALYGNAIRQIIHPLLDSRREPCSARCETSPARGN
jgi:hypothetical protein